MTAFGRKRTLSELLLPAMTIGIGLWLGPLAMAVFVAHASLPGLGFLAQQHPAAAAAPRGPRRQSVTALRRAAAPGVRPADAVRLFPAALVALAPPLWRHVMDLRLEKSPSGTLVRGCRGPQAGGLRARQARAQGAQDRGNAGSDTIASLIQASLRGFKVRVVYENGQLERSSRTR